MRRMQKRSNNNVQHGAMEEFDQAEGSCLIRNQKKVISQDTIGDIAEDWVKVNYNEESDSDEPSQERIQETSNSGFEDLKRCQFLQDWVEVSDTVTFIRSVVEGMYETKILVKNISSWNITYCVIPSSVEKFRILNTIGSIGPKQTAEVIVLSNPEKAKDFGYICREGFTVFATPVYYKSQLQAKKIKLLWRAYGTNLFPYDAAETHKINILLPAEDSYLDNYNFIEKACLGGYIARSDTVDAEWNLKPIEKATFHDNWTPTESPDCIEETWVLENENQLRDWKSAMKLLKETAKSLTHQIRVTVASAVVIGLTLCVLSWADKCSAYGYGGPLSPRAYGSNGQPLHALPQEQKPWWKIF